MRATLVPAETEQGCAVAFEFDLKGAAGGGLFRFINNHSLEQDRLEECFDL